MGVPVTITDFGLIGWGTGASVFAVSGDQNRCRVSVVAGTGPSMSPELVLTFPEPFFPVVPISMAWIVGGTGSSADIANVASNTNTIFTYMDLPKASQTYIFMLDTLGV